MGMALGTQFKTVKVINRLLVFIYFFLYYFSQYIILAIALNLASPLFIVMVSSMYVIMVMNGKSV